MAASALLSSLLLCHVALLPSLISATADSPSPASPPSPSPSFPSSTNATWEPEKLSTWHFCGERVRALSLPGGRSSAAYLDLFRAETQCYNSLVLSFLPPSLLSPLPHLAQTWLRNYVAGVVLYFISAGLWSLYLYRLHGRKLLAASAMPSGDAMWKQIKVSMASMPLYVSLPTLSEAMVEGGWTCCFSQKEEVGGLAYWAWAGAYMLFVEAGVYWMHRLLHDIKPLYRWLHSVHHVYNKQDTLSPFAGLAFHPLDGILQACPHVIALFFIPTHFFFHETMLFLEAVWTANIHDNVDEKIFPIMGAGYHTVHHTTFRHNYGHYTILMDWLFGTLREPEGRAKKEA